MANVRTAFTADDRDLIKSLNDQARATAKINKSLTKQIENVKKVEKSVKGARKESALGARSFGKMGKEILAIGASIGAVKALTGAFAKLNAEAEQGATALVARLGGLKSLGQVTRGPADARFLANFVTELATTTGIGGLAQAEAFVTKARSIQTIKDVEFSGIKRIIGVEKDPLLILDAIAQIQALFPGGEPGSAIQVANKLIAGGALSKTSAGDIAKGVGTAVEGLKRVGIGDEAAIAAVASLTTAFGTPEKAGVKLRSIGAIAAQQKITARDFPELISRITRDPEALKKVKAEKETAGAFDIVKENLPAIREARALVDAQNRLSGTRGSAIQIGFTRNLADPRFRTARNEAIRQGREEVRIEQAAIREEPLREERQVIRESFTPGAAALADQIAGAIQSVMPNAVAEGFIRAMREIPSDADVQSGFGIFANRIRQIGQADIGFSEGGFTFTPPVRMMEVSPE